MQLRTKDIEIFGFGLKLYERTAKEVYDLIEIIKADNEAHTPLTSYIYAAMMINQSLKPNLNNLKWYQIFKYFKIKKIIEPKYLIKNLSFNQINELADSINSLELFDSDKKKMKGSQSVEHKLMEL